MLVIGCKVVTLIVFELILPYTAVMFVTPTLSGNVILAVSLTVNVPLASSVIL